MKLNLTLNEIENGTAAIGGTKERQAEVIYEARHKHPIPISPVTLRDGKRISAIAPTGEFTECDNPVITFRPVWCKLFTVNSTWKKDATTRLVVEFEFGKYMIDKDGIHQANLTTGGNGADPKVVRDSEVALGKLLEAPTKTDLDFHLVSLIQRSF